MCGQDRKSNVRPSRFDNGRVPFPTEGWSLHVSTVSRRAALEPGDVGSLFPPEPGSICSRPTPVVPASEELKALGTRSHPPRISDHAPRPSSRPTLSFELGPDAGAALDAELAAPQPETLARRESPTRPDLPMPSLPPPRGPKRSRVRSLLSKLLFVTLFAGVTWLFGLAAKKKLEASGVPVSAWLASLR